MFWSGHNRWSRRFGLEDGWSTVLSMALVLAVLVYVYPLRMVIASGLARVTGGRIPSDTVFVEATAMYDLQTAFITYGCGFGVLSLLLMLLNRHALKQRAQLQLDAVEELETRTEAGIFAILAGSAALSIALALWMLRYGLHDAPVTPGLPMFTYPCLAIVIPLYVARQQRRRAALSAPPA